MTKQELKPCPFCGLYVDQYVTGPHGKPDLQDFITYCGNCEIEINWGKRRDGFNNRPIEDLLRKRLEEMEKPVQQIIVLGHQNW